MRAFDGKRAVIGGNVHAIDRRFRARHIERHGAVLHIDGERAHDVGQRDLVRVIGPVRPGHPIGIGQRRRDEHPRHRRTRQNGFHLVVHRKVSRPTAQR